MTAGRPYGHLGPWVVALALGVALAGWSAPVAAQIEVAPEEEVDSARIRVLERLRNLSRPPGVDSTLFLPDSTPGQAVVETGPPSQLWDTGSRTPVGPVNLENTGWETRSST